jgi:hypothetical protein
MMPDDIDDMVRAAAARDVHVARLTTGVMARLPSQTESSWISPGVAAFVAMLIATPVAILQYPTDTDTDYVSAASLGEAESLDADLGALLAEGSLE